MSAASAGPVYLTLLSSNLFCKCTGRNKTKPSLQNILKIITKSGPLQQLPNYSFSHQKI